MTSMDDNRFGGSDSEDGAYDLIPPSFSQGPLLARLKEGWNIVLDECRRLLAQPVGRALRVLIGFSGGADSTALLLSGLYFKEELGIELTACHVNHHLRGKEADDDQEQCRKLCASWGLPLAIKHLTLGAAAKGAPDFVSPTCPKNSCFSDRLVPAEAQLRESRYQLLQEAAREAGCNAIALGHTLDDQVETMLFRLFRGTALSGIKGMQAVRKLSDNLMLLRPMLSISGCECDALLSQANIQASHDSSNDNLGYTRNFIRHQVVPNIAKRFPGFEHQLEKLSKLVGEEDRLLSEIAEQALVKVVGKDANTWRKMEVVHLPVAVQRRLIALALDSRGIDVCFERVESIAEMIRAENASSMSLSAAWDLATKGDSIVWVDKAGQLLRQSDFAYLRQEIKIPGITIALALGKALRVEAWTGLQSVSEFPASQEEEAWVDLSEVALPLVLRARLPGDVIRPFGMDKPVRLKKYVHNHKLPPGRSGAVGQLMVVADQVEVIWAIGAGLSEKVRVKRTPTHQLSWIGLSPDEVAVS